MLYKIIYTNLKNQLAGSDSSQSPIELLLPNEPKKLYDNHNLSEITHISFSSEDPKYLKLVKQKLTNNLKMLVGAQNTDDRVKVKEYDFVVSIGDLENIGTREEPNFVYTNEVKSDRYSIPDFSLIPVQIITDFSKLDKLKEYFNTFENRFSEITFDVSTTKFLNYDYTFLENVRDNKPLRKPLIGNDGGVLYLDCTTTFVTTTTVEIFDITNNEDFITIDQNPTGVIGGKYIYSQKKLEEIKKSKTPFRVPSLTIRKIDTDTSNILFYKADACWFMENLIIFNIRDIMGIDYSVEFIQGNDGYPIQDEEYNVKCYFKITRIR
jgi:hypothetical protein